MTRYDSPDPGSIGFGQLARRTPSSPVSSSRMTSLPLDTSTRAPGRPEPSAMSWAKTSS